MKDDTSLLEKLANEPIKLPENPFWDIFKRFGRDEAIAMFINVGGTAVAEIFLAESVKQTILPFVGPVIEKIGFFPAHFKESRDMYKETPAEERENLSYYFKSAVRGGSKSLIEDILIHDPFYIGLMYAGMKAYPETPAWLLSTASFVGAVFAVASLELGYNELAYLKKKHSFKKAGFGTEFYLESRFHISPEIDPKQVLNSLNKEFDIGELNKWNYHDRYFETDLPVYSARIPRLRLRQRKEINTGKLMQTAQVIYTRAIELSKRNIGQYNYFPIRKDKIFFGLDQKMPATFDDIEDKKAKSILKKFQKGDEYNDVEFERTVAYDKNTLLISADDINVNKPFSVVEIKAHNKKDLLKEAIHHVLRNFPVVDQITYGKLDLVNMNN